MQSLLANGFMAQEVKEFTDASVCSGNLATPLLSLPFSCPSPSRLINYYNWEIQFTVLDASSGGLPSVPAATAFSPFLLMSGVPRQHLLLVFGKAFLAKEVDLSSMQQDMQSYCDVFLVRKSQPLTTVTHRQRLYQTTTSTISHSRQVS